MIDPNRAVLPRTALITLRRRARRRRTNISQELFALPENQFNVPPAWYYRVIVSGSVRAQCSEEATVAADTKPPITLPPQYEPRVAGVIDPGYSLYRHFTDTAKFGPKRVDHD